MQDRIPILDLHEEIQLLWGELNEAIQRVLRSGQFILGPEVRALEEEIAAWLGLPHAVGLNSGTDALVIGLHALGIKPGDEVITTPFTFVATPEAISQVGAMPVFVDIDPRTFNIDPRAIEAAVNRRTRAIIPVHLFGQAADMDAISALAAKHGLTVLEDVAQAFGGLWRGRKLGTLGDAGAFSFFPSKNLGAYGDAGLLATRDPQVAERAAMLRTHGSRKRYFNEVLGYNSRLDSMQAAILRVKLRHVDEWNEGRCRAAARYGSLLADLDGVEIPFVAPEAEPVYHQYTLRVAGGRRDAVHERLEAEGIGTMIYYPVPCHRLPIYAHLGLTFPEAERAAAEVLSLPIWPQIRPEVQERVAEAIRRAVR